MMLLLNEQPKTERFRDFVKNETWKMNWARIRVQVMMPIGLERAIGTKIDYNLTRKFSFYCHLTIFTDPSMSLEAGATVVQPGIFMARRRQWRVRFS